MEMRMIDSKQIITRGTGLVLSLLLFATVVSAVVSVPAEVDSLQSIVEPADGQFGAGTSWMIGMTLVEQGDLAGSLPYLMQAWRMSPDEPNLAEIYRDVLFELGYGAEARDVSRHLLSLGRDSIENRERHTMILVALQAYDDALETLAGLQADYPDSLRFDHMEAEIYLRNERYDEATDSYQALRDSDPEQSEAIIATLAEIAQRTGDNQAAKSEWLAGMDQYPESMMLRSGWIRFAVSRSWDKQALAAAEAGDALGENHAPPHGITWIRMTARLIISAGREHEAYSWLMSRLENDQLSVEDRLLLCRLLASRDESDAAVELLEDIVKRWPDHAMAWMYYSEFLGAIEVFDRAEVAARRARLLAPDEPDIMFSLIAILSRRHPDAFAPAPSTVVGDSIRLEILEIAAEAEPYSEYFSANSHMLLATTYHTLGRPNAAIMHYESAAEDPDMLRDALLNLSLVHDDMDNDDGMVAVLERLYQALPEDPVVQNALGYSLVDLDRQLDRAELLIQEALQLEPNNPAFLDSLGWLYFRRGQAVDAFDYLVRAANALPDDPVILEHLARVLLAMGQTDRSLHVAQQALAAGGNPENLADILIPESQE
jgi:tetratricopeptide (TPR) repeat protein